MSTKGARDYFPKRVGWRWQVWFRYFDGSVDPASGAHEWAACSVRYWRWLTCARAATGLMSAYADGRWSGKSLNNR